MNRGTDIWLGDGLMSKWMDRGVNEAESIKRKPESEQCGGRGLWEVVGDIPRKGLWGCGWLPDHSLRGSGG